MNTLLRHSPTLSQTTLDETLLSACLVAGPLFLVTVSRWSNAVLFVAVLLSIYALIRGRRKNGPWIPESVPARPARLLMIAMALPIAAIFLGQLCRHSFSWPYYDSPSRLLIAIPVMLAALRLRTDIGRRLEYAIPTAVLLTFGIVFLHPSVLSHEWGPGRMGTRFCDPLTFGSINFTFALLSLVSVDFRRDTRLKDGYKLLAFVLGVYLSIRSGSRTGWAALPLVLLLWAWSRPFKHKWLASLVALVVAISASVVCYQLIPTVHTRIGLAVADLESYNWNGMNPDTSLGMRISFWRIAFFLFGKNPLGGWGDTGFAGLLNAPEICRYASLYTRQFPLHAGFHNEILTNMVRSGIWGLIASIAIFLIPAAFFIKRLFSAANPRARKLALLAACFVLCELVSGMSTEVLNLKYTAAFYALMVATMAGALLKTHSPDGENNANSNTRLQSPIKGNEAQWPDKGPRSPMAR